MKTKNLKTLLFVPAYIFLTSILFSSCKKGDNPISRGNIDVATGTFTGSLTVYDRPGGGHQQYFNAIVTVTKVGGNQLKVTAKTGEAYSDATPATFTDVRYQNSIVQSNTVMGAFVYLESNKELNVVTEKQTATDRSFTFEGVKQ